MTTGSNSLSPAPARLPRTFVESIDWQLVHRMATLWERLAARSGRAVAVTLRAGLTLDALFRVPVAFRVRLPPALVASLLVHDGQEEEAGALGLFFGTARLLSLQEMQRADAEDSLPSGEDCGGRMLPLTTRVGFQQLVIREADGRVLLSSGFNSHPKAGNLAALLERVLVDTM